MRVVRCIAIVLPLAIALGCSRDDPKQATAPIPPGASAPGVLEAHWITEQSALVGAVRAAEASPLVQRALSEAANPRLTPMPQYAVRAVGRATDGSKAGVTILPYIVDQDQTHAVFVSLLERDGRQLAEFSELILGRAPTSLESGFSPIMIGDRLGYYRDGSTYSADKSGAPRLAPERWNAQKFLKCFSENADKGCAAGSAVGSAIAPEYPAAASAGCGIGVAVVAIGCAVAAFF
jgi:hypothetical protein